MPDDPGQKTAPVAPEAEPSLEGAFSPDGVDRTLIRWMLELTPADRLQTAQDLLDGVWALRPGDEA